MKNYTLLFIAFLTTSPLTAQLSGLYTVGTGGDYSTLADAAKDVNNHGLSGNTIFEIKDGYNQNEVPYITTYPGNNQFTLTIRPEAGASNVTLTSPALETIFLDSTKNVIIDGRPGGISGKSALFIINSNKGNSAGIFASKSTNTLIEYCTIQFDGTRGISIDNSDFSKVENNDITTYSTGPTENGSTIGISTYESTNTLIKNNKIYNLHVAEVLSLYGIQTYNPVTGNSSDSIYNNFIDLNADAVDSSQDVTGISIYQQTSDKNSFIYFNSIVINGEDIKSRSSWSLNFEGAGSLDLKDNLFINHRSNGTGDGEHYAIKLNKGAETPDIHSDYNLFFVDGNGGIFGAYYYSDDTTLTQWQASTTLDMHSIFKDVEFKDITNGDLHLAGMSFDDPDLLGMYIPGIEDIDGQERPSDSTFMGADQPSVSSVGTQVIGEKINSEFTYKILNQNQTTSIQFEINKPSYMDISLYNIMGQKLNSMMSEKLNTGFYKIDVSKTDSNGSVLLPGIYIIRIQTDGKNFARKILLE